MMQHGYLWEDVINLAANSTLFSDLASAIERRNITKQLIPPDPAGDIQVDLMDNQPEYQKWTEREMSSLFAKIFRKELRYNTTAKSWYFFDGRIWKEDTGGMQAAGKAKLLADALLIYCTGIDNEKLRSDFLKYVARYGNFSSRKTLIEDARSEMFVTQSEFDCNKHLINCYNGAFNLNTFELLPHDPEQMLTKLSNIVYWPQAKAKRFESFVNEIMCGDTEKIVYLQKTLGYALTADTSYETCWFWYGSSTRNGKSTLAETYAHMLGNSSGYALAMSPETLAQKKTKDSRQASGDIARLNGCRFLNASEPPKRMLFDAALLKTLLGRDTITARHLYEREFEFIPEFKLFINTNYLPVIQDDTLFSSGRINVLTFDKHFSPAEQDPTLKQTLRTPEIVSGIFNWCLDGLRLYRETGLDPPASVVSATASYREGNDKLQNFFSDCMERTGNNTGAGTAYRAYQNWCSLNGYGIDSKRSFFEELKAKNLLADRGTVDGMQVRNIIPGYTLIPDEEPPTPIPPRKWY